MLNKHLKNSNNSSESKLYILQKKVTTIEEDMKCLQNRYDAILKTVIKNAESLVKLDLWKQEYDKEKDNKEEVKEHVPDEGVNKHEHKHKHEHKQRHKNQRIVPIGRSSHNSIRKTRFRSIKTKATYKIK